MGMGVSRERNTSFSAGGDNSMTHSVQSSECPCGIKDHFPIRISNSKMHTRIGFPSFPCLSPPDLSLLLPGIISQINSLYTSSYRRFTFPFPGTQGKSGILLESLFSKWYLEPISPVRTHGWWDEFQVTEMTGNIIMKGLPVSTEYI